MKRQLTLLLLLCFIGATNLFAQQTLQFDPNTSLMLPEFQALITEDDGEVKVRMRLGASEGAGDKLEAGDLIIMMDGKRIKTIKELKDQYAAAEDDVEMRIGVRRGEERFILRATKGDIPEGSGVVRRTASSGAPGGATGGATTGSMSFSVPGGGQNIIMELGLILKSEDELVKVGQIIDLIAPKEIKEASIEADMVIKEINGKEPTSPENAIELIAAIKVGEDLSIIFEKDGESKTISMKKPAQRAGTTVRRRN